MKLFDVPHYCLQRKLKCGLDTKLQNSGETPIFPEDHKHKIMLIILKLSACEFRAESNAVRIHTFNFEQPNRVIYSFSINDKCRILIGS